MDTGLLAFSFWTSGYGSTLQMVIGFGLVIFLHELGHFLVAKWVGIKVEEFAIGFGKKVVSVTRGETEYRLNILPLGGYVKMLGQEDFALKEGEESDPRAFNCRPIWARMCVVSAGVVMNVIFAAMLFVLVFTIGKEYLPAQIGSVAPASPADSVKLPGDLGTGLKPGDVIEQIDGKPVKKFNRLQIGAMLSAPDKRFRMLIRRPGVPEPFEIRIATEQSSRANGSGRRMFGVSPGMDTKLDDHRDYRDSIEYMSGGAFEAGDTIVSVAGVPIEHGWQITNAFRRPSVQSFEVIAERKADDGAITRHTASMAPNLHWSDDANRTFIQRKRDAGDEPPFAPTPFNVLGLQPRARIAMILPDGPAANAGLTAGDVIAHFGPAKAVPTITQYRDICKESAGKTIDISILRDEKLLDDITTIDVKKLRGVGGIGITPFYDQDHLVVSGVRPDTPFAEVIQSGVTVREINGRPVATWSDLINELAAITSADATVQLTYETPAGAQMKTEPTPLAAFAFDPTFFAYSANMPLATLQKMEKSANPAQALVWGVRETGDFILQTYATLRAFFVGRVSGKEFSGPIGIFRAGVTVGERGTVWLIWLIAIISANLAVINFLPLPIVDGGIMVFLILEKIRKRPLSVAIQNGVQVAGLVLIAVVFVLLTYNDIVQWIQSNWQ